MISISLRARRGVKVAAGALLSVALGAVALRRPADRKDWSPEFAAPPRVELSEAGAVVDGVRDFRWTASEGIPRTQRRAFEWSDVRSAWLLVSPLSPGRRGPAHLMLSFGFRDGPPLAVSAEARRRHGEPYSAWRGLFRRYELAYVVSTERDAVALRAVRRGAPVYRFPIKIDASTSARLLRDALERAAGLARAPEFYNTAFNNCAQNIRRHADRVADRPFGRSWRFLLPGFLDAEAAARGWLDIDGRLDEVRERYRAAPPEAA